MINHIVIAILINILEITPLSQTRAGSEIVATDPELQTNSR